MARILLSTYSNVTFTKEKYHDSFVQGFINTLERMGNEVMSIYGNDYTTHPVKFTNLNILIKNELIKKINYERGIETLYYQISKGEQ